MPSPLVSVLMTSYNRENYIAEAIESVLASTYTNFELIIVDDGSSDKTVEIAKLFEERDRRVKLYINEQNLGDYPNRNKAAGYAKGKYLKYLDSDDLIYPHGLEVFVNSMESHPDAVLGLISKEPLPTKPFPVCLNPEETYRKHFFETGVLGFGPSGSIILREAFEKLNGFSGKRYISDLELWLTIAASNPILELAPSLVFWRRHEQQEFHFGQNNVNEGYFILELPVLEDKLLNPACPLSKEDVNKILRRYRKSMGRHLIKYSLRTGNIRNAIKKARLLHLSFSDLF